LCSARAWAFNGELKKKINARYISVNRPKKYTGFPHGS
jgi:hypothetical protein